MKKKQITKAKIVVLLGSTASGKTSLGVRLAARYQGEIISADSRQVYKGMDIGTAKDLKEYNFEGQNIPYHLIDVVAPKTNFNLAKYQKLAFKAIEDVLSRGKLPIIVGGTGLYLQAAVDNYNLSSVKGNLKQREAWEALGAEVLWQKIKKINEDFALRLNNSEKNNPRRLARYLEILDNPELLNQKKDSPYDFLVLGLERSDEELRERIAKRLHDRLQNENMVAEVENLHQQGLSWKRLISFGLEYRFIAYFLTKKISYAEMLTQLNTASYRFATRQKTWFKRWQKQGREIVWIDGISEAQKEIDEFLGKKCYN